MNIKIPRLSLVLLIGASGSGKSTFARAHFSGTEVLSSDVCRALVSDDENNQAATRDAFDVLHFIAGKRLAAGKLTVVDATNVQPEARRSLVALAKQHHVLTVAIVLDVPIATCIARNHGRSDRNFDDHVIRRQSEQLRASLRGLRKEGLHRVHVLDGPVEIEAVTITRERTWNDLTDVAGPFDIIGDIHGCYIELCELLTKLAYEVDPVAHTAVHPEGRRAIFVGDLVDRGPASMDVVKLVMSMRSSGNAYCVPGNHENKLLRHLNGKKVTPSHGLAETLSQLNNESPQFATELRDFLDGLIGHYVFDHGNLVVAHAGLPESMHGRQSGAVRAFALYGDTTGETDEFGLPIRYPWAEEYRGAATVVYGHTPVPEAIWVNKTICLDTGCVFGGRLSALRYPERELVDVVAHQIYYEPVRPLHPVLPVDDRHDGELDISDVTGKRFIETSLARRVTVREGSAIAALEVMSRWAIDPRWLVYLPPTMSPAAASRHEEYLEYPSDAFSYFRDNGVERVVMEEKHMGSRAVVVVCRTESAAARQFVADSAARGAIFTRTGRSFFSDLDHEAYFVERLRLALDAAGLWEELDTDWLVFDCEILPWSTKALDLIKDQFASVAASAKASLTATMKAVQAGIARGLDLGDLAARNGAEKLAENDRFTDAYRRYCWTVNSPRDIKIAPFQILASSHEVLARREHPWHLEMIQRLVTADPEAFQSTKLCFVNLTDDESRSRGCEWWLEITAQGGEGAVIKPCEPIVTGERGLVQPGLKVRSREYLRIIYGPDYVRPENLERLRNRNVSTKRSLAIREFALGIEALDRLVGGDPLYRVHECVFGVLALESEPVDPRL